MVLQSTQNSIQRRGHTQPLYPAAAHVAGLCHPCPPPHSAAAATTASRRQPAHPGVGSAAFQGTYFKS